MKEVYVKYKEIILYLFFGVLTTIVNIGTFYICNDLLHIDYKVSNLIAWILSVLFAFITNKIWVFKSKNIHGRVFIKEIVSFVSSRLFSLAIDMLLIIVLVDTMHLNKLLAKIFVNVVVVIVNYILSKWIVFKKEG